MNFKDLGAGGIACASVEIAEVAIDRDKLDEDPYIYGKFSTNMILLF